MRKALLLLGLLVACAKLFAQNYPANLIPKELLPYANAVVRHEEINTLVEDLSTVTYHVKRVVTVLNKNGEDEAIIKIFYDKQTKLRNAKGFIYDEFGKQV